jgi:hypothetical protein
MKESNFCLIRIKKKTKKLLDAFKGKDSTYDDVIKEFLENEGIES